MNVGYALLLSALAGLSTTIGSVLGIFVKKPGPRFMALSLGFSAGVMILVSFVELLRHSIESIGFLPAHVAFFAGFVIMFLIDVSIPHDYMAEHNLDDPKHRKRNLSSIRRRTSEHCWCYCRNGGNGSELVDDELN